MTVFGVHAGLQNTSMASLRALWRQVEDLGFGWISVWDHFYSATLTDGAECHEAVATHAALACDTSQRAVRIARLLGRLSAPGGARERDRDDRPPERRPGRHRASARGGARSSTARTASRSRAVKVRLDQLEEAIQCVRGLLRDETTDFKGEWFEMHERAMRAQAGAADAADLDRRLRARSARCASPRSGPTRWNVPFVDPATFAHKRAVLHRHCDTVGRDPAEHPHRR